MTKSKVHRATWRDLERQAEAAAEVVERIREVEAGGSNLVTETLGGREFVEFEHYPAHDVYDPRSHAQYYFHAHPQTRGDWNDYGHFHTFLRSEGIPAGIAPAPQSCVPTSEAGVLSHLIAISMNRGGRPVRLFTTNRWVTAETWYGAADVITMLDRFVVDLREPSQLLNRWISAMLILYRRDIERLLIERDRVLELWREAHPDRDVFEDRGLEVITGKEIDLEMRLKHLRRQLGLEH